VTIQFGRDICGELSNAEGREWLVTNGIGGYACGTLAGLLTRQYHGLLVAALTRPLGRTMLLAKLDETVCYAGQRYDLHANRWIDGSIAPHGYRHIERFQLDGTTPVWHFACADALLEKRIWMQPGANTTYVRYTLQRGSEPLHLSLKALVNYRDHHHRTTGGEWQMQIDPVTYGVCVTAFSGAVPFYLLAEGADCSIAGDWYFGFDLAIERDRGIGDRENHLNAATFTTHLAPGESITLVASTSPHPDLDGKTALDTRQRHEQEWLERWYRTNPTPTAPDWVEQLVLAANQFIVDRPLPNQPNGKTIIAGYQGEFVSRRKRLE
jgi:predicted glycogen debranching enzyme